MKSRGITPAFSFLFRPNCKYFIKFLFEFMVFQIGNVSVSGVEVLAFPNTWSCGDIFFNTTTNKAAFCSSDTMFKLDVSSLVPFNLSDDLTSDREFFLIDIDQPNQLIFPASLIYSGSIPTTVANFTVKSDEQIVGAFGSASGSAWVKNSKVEISIGSNLSISTQFKSSTAFSFDIYFLNSTSSTIIKKKGQDGVPVDPPIVPPPVYSPTIIIDGGTTGFNFTRNSAENRYLMSGSLEIKHGGTGVSSYSELVKKLVPPHPGDGFYVLKSSATNTWEWVALDTTDMVGSILPPAPIDAGIYKYVLTVNEQNQWSWIRDSGGTTSTGVELPAAPVDAATVKYSLTVGGDNQLSWLKDVDLVGSILPPAPIDAGSNKYYLTVNEQNQWSWLKDVDLVGSILPAAPADAATVDYHLTVDAQNQWSWVKTIQQSSGAGGDPLTDLWLIANSADWEMKVVGPITYNGENMIPQYAEIIWPDGARGNFIRTEYDFNRGAVSGFILTYDGRTVPSTHRGFGITKRVTQPTITYHPTKFKLTSRPLRVVSGVTPISIAGNFGTVQVASGTEVSHVVDVSKVSAESVFRLSVGSMPSWMSFDVLSNTFSGTANEDGRFEVTITATDADRFTASAIITFIVGQQQSDVMGGYLSEGPYLTGSDDYIN